MISSLGMGVSLCYHDIALLPSRFHFYTIFKKIVVVVTALEPLHIFKYLATSNGMHPVTYLPLHIIYGFGIVNLSAKNWSSIQTPRIVGAITRLDFFVMS